MPTADDIVSLLPDGYRLGRPGRSSAVGVQALSGGPAFATRATVEAFDGGSEVECVMFGRFSSTRWEWLTAFGVSLARPPDGGPFVLSTGGLDVDAEEAAGALVGVCGLLGDEPVELVVGDEVRRLQPDGQGTLFCVPVFLRGIDMDFVPEPHLRPPP